MNDPTAIDGGGRCGAKTRSGGQCKRPAGHGTDHVGIGRCKLHGGSTPDHRKHAAKIKAARAVEFYGLPREVDPHTALLEELYRTAGHVAWLERVIHAGELAADDDPRGETVQVRLGQSTRDGQTPSIWLDLYERERKHLESVAKTCISLGIEERRVRVAEQQAQLFAGAITGILTELNVIDRPETPDVVRRHLSQLAA